MRPRFSLPFLVSPPARRNPSPEPNPTPAPGTVDLQLEPTSRMSPPSRPATSWTSTWGTLGNHEFDEGGEEALRLVRRARYPYVAPNTVTREGGEPILPPYQIVERSGVKVGSSK